MQKNKRSVLIFLMSIILILSFGGCTDDNPVNGNDGIGPLIESVYPSAGSSGVSVATPIIIVFSEEVDISTFAPSEMNSEDSSFVIDPPTAVDISYSGDSVYIIPYFNLIFNKEYTITISGFIKDKDGNKLQADSTWHFNTGEEIMPLSQNNYWIYFDSLYQSDTSAIYDTAFYYFFDTLIDSTLDTLFWGIDSVTTIDQIIIIGPYVETLWVHDTLLTMDTLIDTFITLEDSSTRMRDTVYDFLTIPGETLMTIFSLRETEMIDSTNYKRILNSYNSDSVYLGIDGKYKLVIDTTGDTLLEYGGSGRGIEVYTTVMNNYYHEGDPVFLSQLFTGKTIYRNDIDGLHIVGAISQHDTVYAEALYLKYPVDAGDTWQTIGFIDSSIAGAGLTLVNQFDVDMECVNTNATYTIPEDTAYTITGDTIVYEEMIFDGCYEYQAEFSLNFHTYEYNYFYKPNFGLVGFRTSVDYFYVSADTLIDTMNYIDTIKVDSFNYNITNIELIDTAIDTTYRITPGVWNLRGANLD